MSKLPNVDANEVNEFIKHLGYSGHVEQLRDNRIVIRLDRGVMHVGLRPCSENCLGVRSLLGGFARHRCLGSICSDFD